MTRGLGVGGLWALAALSCGGGEPPAAPGKAVAPGPAAVRFIDAAADLGLTAANVSGGQDQEYIVETMSAGAAFLDYDGDGFQDVLLVSGTRFGTAAPAGHHRLYRNESAADPAHGLTRQFRDVSAAAGVAQSGWGMGAAAADYDNDGDPDALVTHWGADRLYRNRGDGTFLDAAPAAGVADTGWGSSAAFGDLDADGHLDLYVTRYLHFDRAAPPGGEGRNCDYKGLPVFCGPRFVRPQSDRLYRNRGDGTFADVSGPTGVADAQLPAMGVVLWDLDGDGDLDIYVANDSEPNLLYRNDGDWRLREIGQLAGVAYTEDGRPQASMGVAAGDYDNDGDADLFVTNFADDTNTLYRNDGGLSFSEVTHAAGVGGEARPLLGWGTAFFDYDNDGWLDLFVANGHLYPQLTALPTGLRYAQPKLLYHNAGGTFTRADSATSSAWNAQAVSRAAAVGDYDNDGDADVLVVNLNAAPAFLVNDGGHRTAWLGLQLVGGAASNRDAIGARVTLFAGGRAQVRDVARNYGFQSAHDPRLRFGLGAGDRVDSLRVRWPSGRLQVLRGDLTPGRYHRLEEGAAPVALAPAPEARWPVAAAAPTSPATAAAPGAAWAPFQAAQVGTAADAYAVGKRLYDEGRYDEALAAFSAALEHDPEDLASRVNLAVTLFMGQGRREEAAAEMRRAVAEHPKRYEPRLWLGKLELHGGRLDSALVALRAAVALAPLDGESYHWLGVALLRADSLASARTALERAVRLTPHQPRPHLTLARALDRLGLADDAERRRQLFERLSRLQARVEEFEHLVEEHPGDARHVSNLASAYSEQHRLPEAEARFREAMALDGSYAYAHYGLGQLLLQQQRGAEAVAAFAAACRADSQMAEAFNGLGQAYHQAAQYDSAVAAYQESVRLRPDLVPGLANLGLAYYAQGQYRLALDAWSRAQRLAPDDPRVAGWIDQVRPRLGAATDDRPDVTADEGSDYGGDARTP